MSSRQFEILEIDRGPDPGGYGTRMSEFVVTGPNGLGFTCGTQRIVAEKLVTILNAGLQTHAGRNVIESDSE